MKTSEFSFAPFAFSQPSITKKNIIILTALGIQTGILIFIKDYKAVLNISVSMIAILFVGSFAGLINKEKYWFDIRLITEAVIIGYCVPVNYAPYVLFILIAVSYFVAKILFSGFGENIISAPAFTILVLYFSFPQFFPEKLNRIDLLTTYGSPLYVLQIKGLIKNDSTITSTLNYFFENIGVVIPEGYAGMLFANVSTIPAFRYNLLTLISSAFLFAFEIGEKIIFAIFVIVYGFLVWTFGLTPVDGTYFSGDILTAICTSGILFYAVFVAGESSTVPNTKTGKAILGLILGVVAFAVCKTGGTPVGIAFTIILGNLFTPMILVMEEKSLNLFLRKKYGRK